jgi:hypothetical protein
LEEDGREGKGLGRGARIGFKTGHLRRGPPGTRWPACFSALKLRQHALPPGNDWAGWGPPIHSQSTTRTKQGNVP